uniref:Uncharacterized protein n=1 Tax=Branchiostoma floridae TaxID=7739 RepID=C3ZTI9_BRAFL|eukprot:XP_002588085.1 hypothetical protein BRAFLDRAFT_87602 [Branchiostoma floridae]
MSLKVTCGFARVAVRQSKLFGVSENEVHRQKHRSISLTDRYEAFKENFEGDIVLTFKDFQQSASHVDKVFNTWKGGKTDQGEKQKFLNHFCINKWRRLASSGKEKHTLHGPCKGCIKEHAPFWNLFNKRVKCPRTRKALMTHETVCNITREVEIEGARQIFEQADAICRKQYKRPLTDVLPELHTTTAEQERSKRRKILREAREQLQQASAKNNKDLIVTYGSGESLNARRVRRLAEEFETKAEAEQRSKQRKEKEASGAVKALNRLGKFADFADFDKDGMKQEVMGFENGTTVNWSELARKYNVKGKGGERPSNAGQLIKLWLQEEGVDTERFNSGTGGERIRRARMLVRCAEEVEIVSILSLRG